MFRTAPPAAGPALAPNRAEGAVAAVLAAGLLAAAAWGPLTAGDPSAAAVSTGAIVCRLDVNTATPAELAQLRGVGPVLAGRIEAGRASRGAFRTPDHLLAVRGIGPKTLDRVRPNLRFPADGAPAGTQPGPALAAR